MSQKLCTKYRHVLKDRSLIVDILTIFFGIGTWIGINGTFIQLPLLVAEAPEGWSLPSYLSLMVQIGNIGPIAYTLIQRFSKHKKKDANIIYALLAIGTISSLLTAFFYNQTAHIFDEEHSVSLFALTIFTAINACTSSVLFMPYMGRFKEIYLVTYFIGEGLSGLLPSVVALIQGIGGNTECVLVNVTETGKEIYQKFTPPPRFGSMEFFIFIFAMMLCSCIGFTLLDRLKLSKRQYAAVQVTNGNNYIYKDNATTRTTTTTPPTTPRTETPPSTINLEDHNKQMITNGKDLQDTQVNCESPKLTACQYRMLLLLIGIISVFSNGMLNSIQSYSCLPYGSRVYHLSTTLSVIANPLACFLAMFLPHTSLFSIVTLSGLASILTAYVFVTAVMSPFPPLYGSVAGSFIVISAWTLLVGFISYLKLCITSVMRAQGGKSLVWTGCLTQIGSTLGSLLIFVLINFTNSFKAANDETC